VVAGNNFRPWALDKTTFFRIGIVGL